MPRNTLSMALVGAAGKVAAHTHLHALAMVERAELAALCDVDAGRLDRLGAEHGVRKIYGDYQQVLADPQIDAVDLVVPPFLHAPMAIAAAKAGKHVYVEKPMARSVGEAKAMIQAMEAADRTPMVGESFFFHGPQVMAHDLIAAGEIGPVVQVRMTHGPMLFTETGNQRLGGRGHDAPWRQDGERRIPLDGRVRAALVRDGSFVRPEATHPESQCPGARAPPRTRRASDRHRGWPRGQVDHRDQLGLRGRRRGRNVELSGNTTASRPMAWLPQ